jgi:hypothetical protein
MFLVMLCLVIGFWLGSVSVYAEKAGLLIFFPFAITTVILIAYIVAKGLTSILGVG